MEKKDLTIGADGEVCLYGTYFHLKDFDLSDFKNTDLDPDNFTGSKVVKQDDEGLELSTEIVYDDKHFFSIDHYPCNEKGLKDAENEVSTMTRTMIFKIMLDSNLKVKGFIPVIPKGIYKTMFKYAIGSKVSDPGDVMTGIYGKNINNEDWYAIHCVENELEPAKRICETMRKDICRSLMVLKVKFPKEEKSYPLYSVVEEMTKDYTENFKSLWS